MTTIMAGRIFDQLVMSLGEFFPGDRFYMSRKAGHEEVEAMKLVAPLPFLEAPPTVPGIGQAIWAAVVMGRTWHSLSWCFKWEAQHILHRDWLSSATFTQQHILGSYRTELGHFHPTAPPGLAIPGHIWHPTLDFSANHFHPTRQHCRQKWLFCILTQNGSLVPRLPSCFWRLRESIDNIAPLRSYHRVGRLCM